MLTGFLSEYLAPGMDVDLSKNQALKTVDLLEYTVILQHPEYLPIDGGKFFFEHVRSLPENAIVDAQMAAHDRLTGPDDDAATPSDWKVIACIPGHHSNLAT